MTDISYTRNRHQAGSNARMGGFTLLVLAVFAGFVLIGATAVVTVV